MARGLGAILGSLISERSDKSTNHNSEFLYGCGKTARVKENQDSKAEKKSRRQQVKNLNNARQKKKLIIENYRQ